MSESLEEVRRDIEHTRFALGEKIERLERKIETTTKQTLNPAYHVRTRPWPTLGVFAVLGWMVGRSLKPRRSADKNVVAGSPTLSGMVVRSIASGAARSLGIAAGDLVRDFVTDRHRRVP